MKRLTRTLTFLRFTGENSRPSLCEISTDSTRNSGFVHYRVFYNGFGFPSLTYEYHWKSGHTPDNLKEEDGGSVGIWTRASFVNHSCYPLVRRTYVGDMMIFRAQADIPADTELKIGYISCLEGYEQRQKMLQKWGFQCECQVCLAEKDCSHKKSKKRAKIVEEIIKHFEEKTANDLGMYGHCMPRSFTFPPDIYLGTQHISTPSTLRTSTRRLSSRAKAWSVPLSTSYPAAILTAMAPR